MEIETQDFPDCDTQATQTIYESCSEICIPPWARMTYLLHSTLIELRLSLSWFGRDTPPAEQINEYEVFTFTTTNIDSKYYDRISKCHFIIERMDGPSDDGLRPAVLTCKGRNGIYVNDQRVDLDSKRILSHGDVIKLGKNKHLFKFQYTNIPQEFSSLCRDLRKKYFIGREIGSGGCGLVRLIYNLKTLERFAMKIVKKEMNPMVKNRDDVNEKIINEVNIMRSLNNIHVLGLIDSFATDSNIIIVMEYLEGRDLLHRITKHNPKRTYLNENDAKYYFLQICRGLKYLHDSKITHRDIKPDNILLVSNDTDSLVKISDFGLSKIIAEADMKTVCGTQLYVAPEILKNGNKGYSNKVDIWSLGCLLFAMLSGSVPFCDAYAPPDLMTQIKNAKYSFSSRVWKTVSDTAKNLIEKMLQKDPQKRVSIEEILAHNWLKCPSTRERLEKVYKKNGIDLDETDLELTLVNVTLNEIVVKEPPLKKRRVC